MALTLSTPAALSPTELAAVRSLVHLVEADEGRAPLSDQTLTQLASSAVEHVVATGNDGVTGYAQFDGSALEIVAEPAAIDPLLQAFDGRNARIWSHGKHSRLIGPLTERGFERERELLQLRRPLAEPVELPPVPDGVQVRTFVVGKDEDAWVQVNAAAFADHPEQGRWTRADLEAREREAWFDPDGFLLAERDGSLVGFHWTKVHPDGAGEVYVIGVDPQAQGLGLGAVLLRLGLAALYDRGCREVLLYVDASNSRAVALYESYGFGRYDVDVQWRAPSADQSSTGSVSST